MNNITALMATMKAAAEKATPGPWHLSNEHKLHIRDEDGIWLAHVGYFDSPTEVADGEFIALANPANVLALVEALEKAQEINAAAEKLVRCKGRYHSEQNYRALAALFGVNVPDLPPLNGESRTVTVKLPDEVDVLLNHLEDVLPSEVFQLIDVHKWNAVSRLSAIGIQVIEGEGQ